MMCRRYVLEIHVVQNVQNSISIKMQAFNYHSARNKSMPVQIHKSDARGKANHGWLDTRHSFSFARWYNPEHMGIGPLRVLNQDIITGGSGFPTHGHRDMDIVSIVLRGGLEHEDSEGNIAVIRPGEVQRMTAGTGVTHSEMNHYADQTTEFLQIWVVPDQRGLAPSYEQLALNPVVNDGQPLPVLASPRGTEGGVALHQDAHMLGGEIKHGVATRYTLEEGRLGYLHMPKGSVTVGEQTLEEGDGMYLVGPETLDITATSDGYLLLFDVTSA